MFNLVGKFTSLPQKKRKNMNEEQKKRIEEMADNYMRGRAMALSFKPLTLEDIKEAFLCGAEDMVHLIDEEDD